MAKLVIGNNKTVGVPVITKEIEKLPALGLMREKGVNGILVASKTESQIMDFTGVTDVSAYMLTYAYSLNTAISGAVDMSDLTTISGASACTYMFQGCTGLTSVDLSSLTTISGNNACSNMFQGCISLTSVDLSSLTTVNGNSACQNMFYNCTGLTNVDLSALTTLTGVSPCYGMFNGCTGLTIVNLSALTTVSAINACQSMFAGCRGITSADLSSLTTLTGSNACTNMFYGCTSLTTVYIGGTTAIDFGTRTNQFSNMFANTTQNIDVYAPAASQTVIESMSGYPNFGGTGTVTWHWNTAE